MTSPLGFKVRVGSALFALGGGVRVMLHVKCVISCSLCMSSSLVTEFQFSQSLSRVLV